MLTNHNGPIWPWAFVPSCCLIFRNDCSSDADESHVWTRYSLSLDTSILHDGPQYAEKSGCVVILNLPQELSSPAMFGPCPRVHHHINSIAHANSKCNVCIYMFCYMHPYIVDPCSSPAELIFPDNTS